MADKIVQIIKIGDIHPNSMDYKILILNILIFLLIWVEIYTFKDGVLV